MQHHVFYLEQEESYPVSVARGKLANQAGEQGRYRNTSGCDRNKINSLDRSFVTRILCAVSEGLVHILLEQTLKKSC
jgi:hypothetical protein